MIPVQFYSATYYIIISIAVIMLSLPLTKNDKLKNYPTVNNNFYSTVILLITILFIGLRDPYASFNYLGDTGLYTMHYMAATFPSFETARDFGFSLFMYGCSQIMNVQWFYLLCAILYVLPPYLAFKKWFKDKAWIALIVYVCAMSFWAFGINGLRNGLGASFFIFGISFIDKPFKMFLLFLLAVVFHKSMLLPICSFLLAKYIKNTKLLICIWVLSIPIAFFFGNIIGISFTEFLNSHDLGGNRVDNLFLNEIGGKGGLHTFRLDFILYSSVALIGGYYYMFKRKFESTFYKRILNTYIIANTVWILLIYATFTNRTAYLSWLLMPIILVYPLLRSTIVRKPAKWVFGIIFGSLTFTLIMFLK